MPPKPKHTREEMIAAGVEIVREKGIEALSSRELGARLGTTARPIFTAFANMDELYGEIQAETIRRFEEYGKRTTTALSGFEKVGCMIASFATEEPNLFKVLFLQNSKNLYSVEAHFNNMRNVVDICFGDIQKAYALTEKQVNYLFDQFWIYTFGISTLCEMGLYRFTKQEIIDRLNAQVDATLKQIQKKNEKK